MIFILGILDLISALILGLKFVFSSFPDKIVIIAAIYLIVKGALFLMSKDFASIIDIFCGIVLIFSAFMIIPFPIFALTLVFLVQKGIFSLIS